MIKFFRKIRQQLLSENKFTKYLIYAVGEIVLVVIGILIALSINNSNDAEKLRLKERVVLTQMQQNLKNDIEDLNFNIRGTKTRLRANEVVLSALQNRTQFYDSLQYYYAGIFGNFQFSENTAAWENLKSVGLDLVSNDSLRNAISELYTLKYGYIENLERGLDDTYQWNTMYPQVLEHINLDTVWVSAMPVDHEGLMDDREFQEILKMNMFLRKFIRGQYIIAEKDANAILVRLEKHIKTLGN